MKRIAFFMAIVMMLSFGAGISSAASQKTYEVSYSSKAAGAIQDKAMDLFAEKMSELSGGRITGKKYVGGTIGGEEELVEAVSLGDLGSTCAADVLMGNIGGGGLGWESLPGLVTSYEEVERDIFAVDGWISKLIDEFCENKLGVKRLAGGDNGFRVLGTNKAIKKPEDFVGVKIRCGNSWENLQLYGRAGAIAVVVASSETLAAIQQGTVDGAENGLLNLQSAGIQNALSYVLLVNQMYSACSFIVNLEWYNSLSEEDQTIVSQAAKLAAEYEIKATRDAEQKLINEQVSAGKWTMLEMTPELVRLFEKVSSSMWEDAREIYGTEIINTIIANKIK